LHDELVPVHRRRHVRPGPAIPILTNAAVTVSTSGLPRRGQQAQKIGSLAVPLTDPGDRVREF
ncbi:hypothetical protein, partial [Dactylosporangium fulvum]|uniref:hypothetical protein n=1 Tax=Dactylosporangium fulvum TaxID=53359 RepID=UPI0031D0D574